MKDLQELQRDIGDKILELRSIERILRSKRFAAIYNESFDPKLLDTKKELIRWIKKQCQESDYSNLPLRDLRKLARELCVPKWFSISKRMLLSEIANAKGSSQRNGFQHPKA